MKVEFLLRYRLSETLITLLTINASTFERYQPIYVVYHNNSIVNHYTCQDQNPHKGGHGKGLAKGKETKDNAC